MVRWRDNTERWNRLLDIYWLSNPCLKQSGVTYYAMLSLLSTQQLLRNIGCSPFELVYGEQVRLPVDIIVGRQSGMSNAANFV